MCVPSSGVKTPPPFAAQPAFLPGFSINGGREVEIMVAVFSGVYLAWLPGILFNKTLM